MKLLFAFALAVILYFLQYHIYVRLWNRKLNVTIGFAENVVEEGRHNTLIETIENKKWLPIPILQIKFATTRSFIFAKEKMSAVTDQYYRNEFFSIMPYQRVVRELPFVCGKRGCYRVNGMDVISKDLFLTHTMFKHLEHDAVVYVLPKRIPIPELAFSVDTLFGNVVKNSRINEDPFEFAGIRDYQPYDNMHSINWKNTAKRQTIQVNTYYTTYSNEMYVLLNVDTNMVARAEYVKEEAIRIADAVANMFLFSKVPVGFYSNGSDIFTNERFTIEAGAGKNHIETIELALARIDLAAGHSDFMELMDMAAEHIERNTKFVIVSNYRKDDIREKYQAMCDAGFSCAWIVPELHDVEVEDKTLALPNTIKWEVAYGD